MISRHILPELKKLLQEYPVVTVLGPRQAGKTTLVCKGLPSYTYSNLESPETREFASTDPKAYLSQFKGPTILDEIQRVPELISYIQTIVDEEQINGRFILTGSHQLELHAAVSQSLAGRTAIVNLLPFSISELADAGVTFEGFEDYCIHGFLPRIYDQKQRPSVAYANYYATYVERDVRQLVNIKDISLFEKLIKLVAGRVGQLADYSSLANDVGVDSKTIKKWISILEASFVLVKLPPFHNNFGKRVIKSPKYYFTDVGLLCYILGIEKPEHVIRDPLVGSIFENLVVIEALKERFNQGKKANLYFFRDSNGNEVDLLLEEGRRLIPFEIKSAQTFSSHLTKNIKKFRDISRQVEDAYLIYNGDNRTMSEGIKAHKFNQIRSVFHGGQVK